MFAGRFAMSMIYTLDWSFNARVSIRHLCVRTMVSLNLLLIIIYSARFYWISNFFHYICCFLWAWQPHNKKHSRTKCTKDKMQGRAGFLAYAATFNAMSCFVCHWFCGWFCSVQLQYHQIRDHVANATNAVIDKCKKVERKNKKK